MEGKNKNRKREESNLTIAFQIPQVVIRFGQTDILRIQPVLSSQCRDAVDTEEDDVLRAVVGVVDGLGDGGNFEPSVDDGDVTREAWFSWEVDRVLWSDHLSTEHHIVGTMITSKECSVM